MIGVYPTAKSVSVYNLLLNHIIEKRSMKKMILSLALALTTMSAFAQFEAGRNYIGASLSGIGLSYSKQAKVNLNMSLTAGRMLADNWMILGNMAYEYNGQWKTHALEIGAGGRYYIIQNGLYLGLDAAYAFAKGGDETTHNCFITPEVGYAFFLGEHVTIEPAIYYRMSINNFADASTVGLKIGFGYYF